MFDQLREQDARTSCVITRATEFIEDYERFIKAINWFARMAAQGRDTSDKLMEFHELERKVDSLWSCLSQEQKEEVAESLIEKGYLPEKLRAILKMFNGKVVNVK